MFAQACMIGLEGIVSKRKTSPYRSGRSPDWIMSKNPACEAVKREEEEGWAHERSQPDLERFRSTPRTSCSSRNS